MNKRNTIEVIPRLLDRDQLALYLSLGKASAVQFAIGCNAAVSIGRRRLFDRSIIDKELDRLQEN